MCSVCRRFYRVGPDISGSSVRNYECFPVCRPPVRKSVFNRTVQFICCSLSPKVAPGFGLHPKCTFICRGSQPAETVNEPSERAGLRGARLRPARPKGRKTCPGHLTVQLLQGQIPEEAQIVTVRPARPQIFPLTIRSLKSRRLRRTPHSRQLPRNRQRASSRYCFRIPP